jgi:hypothetical protein
MVQNSRQFWQHAVRGSSPIRRAKPDIAQTMWCSALPASASRSRFRREAATSRAGIAPVGRARGCGWYLSEAELVENLLEISRSSVAALDGLWSPTGGGDSIALNDTTEDEAGPRGANAARDWRGPRGDRVARLAAAHEGDPAPEGAPAPLRQHARGRPRRRGGPPRRASSTSGAP